MFASGGAKRKREYKNKKALTQTDKLIVFFLHDRLFCETLEAQIYNDSTKIVD
ncbi:hypothetical protein JCM21714_3473 [Gracilibacillus boraciitolerans JCM 21714]|uniref:Uncharacterized protein n=1 Tax=Gracilibacillus boraciitolerans JCM 21714 TaxID=1298598 RepID=W4VMB2_9BACI|nr:hypothetical protein JCM21714_3473 [Gracilibacillus boraciitolerans JCM 21714]